MEAFNDTKKRLNDESPKIKRKRKGIRKLMLNFIERN